MDFRKTKLWERMYDSELFAVRMADGEIGYCCVMGMQGAHLALAVYPGDAGLASFRMLSEPSESLSENARTERGMSQDCIMCSFEYKDELSVRDIRALKETGLIARGKNACPLFRRCKPSFYPWYLETAEDEGRMALALAAGLEVARKLADGKGRRDPAAPAAIAAKEALGFTAGAPYDRTIPLLEPKAGGAFTWNLTALPKPEPVVHPSPKLTDDLMVAKLKKLEKGGAWECGMLMYPEPVASGAADVDGFITEPESAPYFPFALIVVDHQDGMILRHGLTSGLGQDAVELLGNLMQHIVEAGRPSRIYVPDVRTHALLSGVAEQIDIPLTQTEDLPFLRDAIDSLDSAAGGNPEGDIDEMLDHLLAAGDGDLPDEIKAQLQALLESGMLSAPLTDKLRRVLRRG